MNPADDETRVIPQARPESTGISAGSILNHTYRVEQMLNRGGMGEIYRASHVDLPTEHAIKVIRPEFAHDPKILELFRREASALRTVRDDAVVAYDGAVRDEEGRLYLVMEFVRGESLADLVGKRQFSVHELRVLLSRLAGGLAAAHDKGIIHRDMSPDNVILPEGKVEKAKIIDFGIAKNADPNQATVIGNDFAGKYFYAAPEQLGLFGGKVDQRSDIFSLGLVIGAVARGKPLDTGNSLGELMTIRQGLPNLDGVPPEIRADLTAMLQPDPANRPKSMRDLIRAEGPTRRASDRGRGAKAKPAGGSRPNKMAIAAGAAVVVVGGAIAGYLVMAGGSKDQAKDQPETLVASNGPVAAGATQSSGGAPVSSSTTNAGAASTPRPAPTAAVASASPPPAVPAAPPPAAAPRPVPVAAPPAAVSKPPAPPEPSAPTPRPANTTVALAPPPRVTADDLRAKFRRFLAEDFQCARLTLAGAGNGRSGIQGIVSNQGDLLRLRSAVDGEFSPIAGSINVAVRPWPYCETIVKLATHTELVESGSDGPRIEPNRANGVYRDGDEFIVNLVAPRSGTRFLYFGYMNSQGGFAQLFPAPGSDGRVTPGQKIVLGGGGKFIIGSPYGTDMLVAIASDAPIASRLTAPSGQAAEFLSSLGRAFTGARANVRAESRVVFITAKP